MNKINQSGFTITEILAGLAIFSVAAIPLGRYLFKATESPRIRELQYATQLASYQMEKYLAISNFVDKTFNVEYNGSKWTIMFQVTGNSYKEIVLSTSKGNRSIVEIKAHKFCYAKAE